MPRRDRVIRSGMVVDGDPGVNGLLVAQEAVTARGLFYRFRC
jgi:hypothetical protein